MHKDTARRRDNGVDEWPERKQLTPNEFDVVASFRDVCVTASAWQVVIYVCKLNEGCRGVVKICQYVTVLGFSCIVRLTNWSWLYILCFVPSRTSIRFTNAKRFAAGIQYKMYACWLSLHQATLRNEGQAKIVGMIYPTSVACRGSRGPTVPFSFVDFSMRLTAFALRPSLIRSSRHSPRCSAVSICSHRCKVSREQKSSPPCEIWFQRV